MNESVEEQAIAEKYLKEMLKADDTGDFELFIKRYESKYLGNFSPEIHSSDIKHMHEKNGMNIGYEFLAKLRNYQTDDLDIFRFIWKGIYEKRDAVIEIAIYQKNGIWHVIKSNVT